MAHKHIFMQEFKYMCQKNFLLWAYTFFEMWSH